MGSPPPLVPIGAVFDDHECFEVVYPDGELEYHLTACEFDGCRFDGVMRQTVEPTAIGDPWGVSFEGFVVDCGGPQQIDLDGVEVECDGYASWAWTCYASDAASTLPATEVRTRGILEYVDPDATTEPSEYRERHAVHGAIDGGLDDVGGEARTIEFDADQYPVRFDSCAAMVPGSGLMVLRDGSTMRARVSYVDCERFTVCLDQPEHDSTGCVEYTWSEF